MTLVASAVAETAAAELVGEAVVVVVCDDDQGGQGELEKAGDQ